jgi:hypothetical protein
MATGQRRGCRDALACSRRTLLSKPGTQHHQGVPQHRSMVLPADGMALRRVDYDGSSADSQNGNGRDDDLCIRVRLRPGEGGVEPDRVREKTSKLEEKRQGYLRAQRRCASARFDAGSILLSLGFDVPRITAGARSLTVEAARPDAYVSRLQENQAIFAAPESEFV